MKKTIPYKLLFLLLLGIMLSNLCFGQAETTTQHQAVSLNSVIKLDQLDPNAIITLDIADHTESGDYGIKFYDYSLKYITAQNQNGADFRYSAEHQCFIPVLDKNISGIKQEQASIKIGFHKQTPINIRIPRSQLDNTTTLAAILSAHFSKDFDQNQMLLIASCKTSRFPVLETENSEAANNKLADVFILTELSNLRTLPSIFFKPETRAFVLSMPDHKTPINILDNENRRLQSLIFIDIPGQQFQKLSYSTYGMCWMNHQSIKVDKAANIIPVYLSCSPDKAHQVTLNIIQPYPVYLSAKSRPLVAMQKNSLSFDLFNEKFIQLTGSTTLPYSFIYLDLSDQFLKSKAIEVTDNLIESIQHEKSTFSVFASNHLKPVIFKSADYDKETKNQYFMRLLSLAPNPPGIYQETQLIYENCFNTDFEIRDPLHLLFVFTSGNASFNLKIINSILMELPQDIRIDCTIYIPAQHIGLYKTEELLKYRFLDNKVVNFQYFK